MGVFVDITGVKYTRLTVLSREESRKGISYWKCRCDCGSIKIVALSQLKGGGTKSCGCLNSENAKRIFTKHGMYETPTYSAWEGMVSRCNNPNNRKYHLYGGAGIKVCDEWLNFINFYEDMGLKPDGLSLGRIDGKMGYCKENCRWETIFQQNNNTSQNVFLTVNGETKTITQWAKDKDVNRETMRSRAHKSLASIIPADSSIFMKVNRRFNEGQIKEIRCSSLSTYKLAKIYDCNSSTIFHIKKRHTYADIK